MPGSRPRFKFWHYMGSATAGGGGGLPLWHARSLPLYPNAKAAQDHEVMHAWGPNTKKKKRKEKENRADKFSMFYFSFCFLFR